MNNDLIIFNNEIISSNSCSLAFDRGYTLGDGIFETILSIKNTLPFFEQHWHRLSQALKLLNIPNNYNKDYLYSKIIDLLAKQANTNKHSNFAGIKIIVTRGQGPRSVEPLNNYNYIPNLLITTFPINEINLKNTNNKTLSISDIKVNQSSPLSKIKSLNYLDRVLAKKSALEQGYDDALLVNFNNHITSASTSNIFFILQDNSVITPQISDGVLEGITRKFVISTLKDNNIKISEQSILLDDISNHKSSKIISCFTTNSIQGINQVTQINDYKLSSHQFINLISYKFIKKLELNFLI